MGEPVEKMTNENTKQNRGWRFWAILTSMAVSSLLAGLDATAVSTAMPSIIHDLGASQGYVWIANAYLLTTTAFTPIFGKTANIFGPIAGPAPKLRALVVGRAVQGIGCAGLNTMVEMVVCDLVPLRERGKFMGFILAIYAISTTVGPLVGRAFASYATCSIKRVDFAGNVLLATAITSILLALTWGGGQFPWSSWRTILPLVLGLVGLPLFLLFETRIPEPTTPFRIFSNRTSLAGCLCAFHNMLVFWILFVLPVYFQAVLGTTAFRSGVNILPTAAVFTLFTIISGGVMSKLGRYRPLLMVGFAFFPLAFGLFTRLNETSTTGYWVGIQILAAVAIGIITPVTLQTILTPLAESDVAVGTATWAFIRGFGTIWGAAIPLAVFNSKADELVATRLADNESVRKLLENGGAYTLSAGGSLYSTLDLNHNPTLAATVKGIYADSLRLCWQVGLAFALFGFLLTFLAKELPMRTELETEFGLVEESKNESDGETGEESVWDEDGRCRM
ncbi:putative multidrug resistance protein fnx1 [Xylaria arbuscula]|nr:putative multidrug resistance protein fnx1 [Xylaria arbuscula]